MNKNTIKSYFSWNTIEMASELEHDTSVPSVFERKSDTALFMYGRFNPPTIGHGKMFELLAEDAKNEGADAFVFPTSRLTNSKKNPLTIDQKLKYLLKKYGHLPIYFVNTTTCPINPDGQPCTGITDIFKLLIEGLGYTTLKFYLGSDRVDSFNSSIVWYIEDRRKRTGIYQPKFVEIVSKLPPRTQNNNISGVSATKVREAAIQGNVSKVMQYTGLSNENASQLMQNIVIGSERNSNQPSSKRPKSTAKKGGKRRTLRRHHKK